jgi:hypothetical protein
VKESETCQTGKVVNDSEDFMFIAEVLQKESFGLFMAFDELVEL